MARPDAVPVIPSNTGYTTTMRGPGRPTPARKGRRRILDKNQKWTMPPCKDRQTVAAGHREGCTYRRKAMPEYVALTVPDWRILLDATRPAAIHTDGAMLALGRPESRTCHCMYVIIQKIMQDGEAAVFRGREGGPRGDPMAMAIGLASPQADLLACRSGRVHTNP